MNKHTVSVLIATSLGAFIGSTTALALPGYWWLIGVVIGGLTGYLTYDFKRALAAIPIAWRQTRVACQWSISAEAGAIAKEIPLHLASTLSTAITACSFIFLTIQSLDLIFSSHTSYEAVKATSVVYGVAVTLCFLSVLCCHGGDRTGRRKLSFTALKKFNLLTILFYWLPRNLCNLVRLIISLVKNLFILIHSDLRLLCGTDAAIGTVIGFMTGNPLVGLAVGGLVGYLNFELVSKLWLRLVPVNND
ncbi:MAG TPA: hypothetical protein VJC05_00345 [Candidatus Andersenbacteria bacterium]|nr:hypothetical protein [Candidatus Andersenbacteria bacterium]